MFSFRCVETGNPPFSIYPPETECKLDTDHWVSMDIYCNKIVQDCAQEGLFGGWKIEEWLQIHT